MNGIKDQLGVGLGYRHEFSDDLERNLGSVDFLEIVGDQCFDEAMCDRVQLWTRKIPSVCHFLGMSIGTAEPLDEGYLAQVATVLERLRPAWFSDHLAMTRVLGLDLGHLTPVACTEETAEIVSAKAAELQRRFGLPFLLENITCPFSLPGSSLPEWALLTRIVESADCGILLDLTNLHVNARNNDYDAYEYLESIPLERVVQVHLGGAHHSEGVWIDSHADPVPEEVFALLDRLCRRSNVAAVSLERDRNMPDFQDLLTELARARTVMRDSRQSSSCELD